MNQVTLEQVKQARERIRKATRHTPLEYSRSISHELKRDVFLKLECFQPTGSFKIRGAMARLTSLSEAERQSGVLTVSAGNHGLAVAAGSEALNIDATIVVPQSASRAKVAAIGRYGVTLVERGANYDEAERTAREMERDSRMTFISPYNDVEVIAGQGTMALEILADVPDVDSIVVPVGGGGLLAGVALTAKAMRPDIKIYGAEPAATPTMREALKAGHIVEITEDETLADGLAGNIEPGSITFPIIQQFVDGMITVSEAEIKSALQRFAREEHILIEGSAAVSLAALHSEQLANPFKSQRVVAVITGRNISLDLFIGVVTGERE